MAVIVALWMPVGAIRSIVLWGATLVLLGRGLIAYAGFWRKMAPVEPFASNDRRFYGPLCLGLGLGLLLMQLKGV